MKLVTPAFDCDSDANVCQLMVSSTAAVQCDSRGMPYRISFYNLNIGGYTLPQMTQLPPRVLSNLATLDLSYNYYIGSIPYSYIHLSRIRGLALGWNLLTGTIPSYFGLFTYIGRDMREGIDGLLDVGGNRLTGTLPPELGYLHYVAYFYAYFNALTGSIPDSYGDMVGIRGLYLNGNFLTGTIPICMSKLTRISQLYLFGNSLSGTIPEIFQGYVYATDIYLQRNSFVGAIPTSLGGATSLTVLDLSNNMLTGSIPSSLCSLQLNLLYVGGKLRAHVLCTVLIKLSTKYGGNN